MEHDITLTFEEREKLDRCPRCGSQKFELKVIKIKHPIFKGRPIYQCCKCGYWTDWFDGWVWHPPSKLKSIRQKNLDSGGKT